MLALRNVTSRFGAFSLQEVTFTVERGDYFILLGESGAGKSMVLESIAGLVIPDSGSICLDGVDITHDKIQNRSVGLVFQDQAIFPHLTVADNIAYPLHGKRLSREEKHLMVQSIAGELGIGELLARRPATLSGGELQRVALGRTLIQRPSVLLLDEPLSSLDTGRKSDLRRLLRSIHRKGQTILHVTHDYEEALSLATRVAVLHQGRIVQSGAPSVVFREPKSEFVARFTGVKNFFPALLRSAGKQQFAFINGMIPVSVRTGEPGGDGFVLIRAEQILVSAPLDGTGGVNQFPGRVVEVVPCLSGVIVTIEAGIELQAVISQETAEILGLAAGMRCLAHFQQDAVRFINSQ